MSESVARLTGSERVVEWIDPFDQRLINLSGEEPPVDGGMFREFWEVDNTEEEQAVAREVARLLVPESVQLKGDIAIRFTNEVFGTDMGEGTGNVVAHFADTDDWSKCFPTERSVIFRRKDGRTAWGAVALCGDSLGLAVFSQQLDDGRVEARVQVVPDEALQQIVAATK